MEVPLWCLAGALGQVGEQHVRVRLARQHGGLGEHRELDVEGVLADLAAWAEVAVATVVVCLGNLKVIGVELIIIIIININICTMIIIFTRC